MVMASDAEENFTHISALLVIGKHPKSNMTQLFHAKVFHGGVKGTVTHRKSSQKGRGQQIAETQKCRSRDLRKPHWCDQIKTTAW